MLNTHETQLVLEKFFKDCTNFWDRQGYDERESFIKAIEDVERITTDPFSPCGKKLNMKTKEKFLGYRRQDVGL